MSLPKKNHLWIWFFVFVIAASVALAGFMIWFNLRLQLTPEKLEAARQKWKEHGPKDYAMTITTKLGEHVDVYKVKVEGGKVMEVRLNGELLRNQETDVVYKPGHAKLQYYSMERQFVYLEGFLESDAKKNEKNHLIAIFNEKTGALEFFTRSERATRMHVEQKVTLEP
jgi:hypothetical protein